MTLNEEKHDGRAGERQGDYHGVANFEPDQETSGCYSEQHKIDVRGLEWNFSGRVVSSVGVHSFEKMHDWAGKR